MGLRCTPFNAGSFKNIIRVRSVKTYFRLKVCCTFGGGGGVLQLRAPSSLSRSYFPSAVEICETGVPTSPKPLLTRTRNILHDDRLIVFKSH